MLLFFSPKRSQEKTIFWIPSGAYGTINFPFVAAASFVAQRPLIALSPKSGARIRLRLQRPCDFLVPVTIIRVNPSETAATYSRK